MLEHIGVSRLGRAHLEIIHAWFPLKFAFFLATLAGYVPGCALQTTRDGPSGHTSSTILKEQEAQLSPVNFGRVKVYGALKRTDTKAAILLSLARPADVSEEALKAEDFEVELRTVAGRKASLVKRIPESGYMGGFAISRDFVSTIRFEFELEAPVARIGEIAVLFRGNRKVFDYQFEN